MFTRILLTPPHRLTIGDFALLHAAPALRDAYNARWNVALY